MTVITPSGKFLFANDLTLGRIFAYAIGSNGALSPVTGSPFAVPAGGQPTRLAMDSTGQYLYASLLTDGVAAFKIDGSTGSLVDVPGSPFLTSGQPSGIAVSSSNFVYITSSVAVDGFKADAVGTLSPVSGSPFQLSSSSPIVDATGQFLYVIGSNSTIYGFKIDPTSGAFNAISGSPFTSVQNPWLLTPLKIP
jgi:6-phosphogluconolactonase (cycloisomerase 2 family)